MLVRFVDQPLCLAPAFLEKRSELESRECALPCLPQGAHSIPHRGTLAMSTCTNVVDTISISCKNWGSKLEYECINWAAQGILTCSQWADEGSNQCTSWSKCHWYTPWNCIAGFFCRAFYWVASFVCIAFLIVTLYACLAFGWVTVKIFCPALWGVMDLTCLGGNFIWCGWLAIAEAIGGLFGKDPGSRELITSSCSCWRTGLSTTCSASAASLEWI